MAKKGMKPSEIGVNLRDQHGVPLVRFATYVFVGWEGCGASGEGRTQCRARKRPVSFQRR